MARVVNQTHREHVRQDYAGAREDWNGSRCGEEEPLDRVLVMTTPKPQLNQLTISDLIFNTLEGDLEYFLNKLN